MTESQTSTYDADWLEHAPEEEAQFTEAQLNGRLGAKRTALVADAWALIHHEPQVHYRQQRPMRNERDHMVNVLDRFRRGIGMWMDCSEAVSFLFFTTGCHDPNGMNFNGVGNSGMMYEHCHDRYHDPNRALPGALVVYGHRGSEHVCMVMAHDAHNPLLFSHGQERGPLAIRLRDENAAHSGQDVCFLSIAALL
jgi:hypothetical protein